MKAELAIGLAEIASKGYYFWPSKNLTLSPALPMKTASLSAPLQKSIDYLAISGRTHQKHVHASCSDSDAMSSIRKSLQNPPSDGTKIWTVDAWYSTFETDLINSATVQITELTADPDGNDLRNVKIPAEGTSSRGVFTSSLGTSFLILNHHESVITAFPCIYLMST